MTMYWLTFRLEKNHDYANRYDKLTKEIEKHYTSQFWDEPTSFYIFDSALGIDQIAANLKKVINTRVDIVMIRKLDNKEARIIGTPLDPDIFTLVQYAKQV